MIDRKSISFMIINSLSTGFGYVFSCSLKDCEETEEESEEETEEESGHWKLLFENFQKVLEKVCEHEESEKDKCYRCGREGHYIKSCYAKRHVNGKYI